MSARIEAANLERTQNALRCLAAAWRLPLMASTYAALRHLRRWSQVLPLISHGIVSNGYYHVGDSGQYLNKSDEGRLLQQLVESMSTAEDAGRAARLAREMKLKELVAYVRHANYPGFFPTPPEAATIVLNHARIEKHMLVLEPSAGAGDLVNRILQMQPDCKIDCVELNHKLREIIELWFHGDSRVSLVGTDIMDLEPDRTYHRIVMNPPFENGADCVHVMHAFKHLKPHGRLVSVMAPGWTFEGVKGRGKEFREWIQDKSFGRWDLPAGSFEESGTSVASIVVVIDKEPESK